MSYTMTFQVWEDQNSSSPLLQEESVVDADTVLRCYSQVLHTIKNTAGPKVKVLADVIALDSTQPAERVEFLKECPDLDMILKDIEVNPEGLFSAESNVQPLVDECEAEQDHKPTIDTPDKIRKWEPEEKEFLCNFATAAEALTAYRLRYPSRIRTDKSITSYWYVLRQKDLVTTPDTAEQVEEDDSSSHSFRLNDYVSVRDKNMPCYGETGKILSIRNDEALVAFSKSTYWIALRGLQPEEHPSKN